MRIWVYCLSLSIFERQWSKLHDIDSCHFSLKSTYVTCVACSHLHSYLYFFRDRTKLTPKKKSWLKTPPETTRDSLRLTFSHPRRRGILWDTFDVYPDVPEGTFFSKTCRSPHQTGARPLGVKPMVWWKTMSLEQNGSQLEYWKIVAGFKYLQNLLRVSNIFKHEER